MGWLNNQIAKIAPMYAVKRELAAISLKRLQALRGRRSIEAGLGGRMRSDFLLNKNSADHAMDGSENAKYNVRQLEQNNGFVSGPILRVVNNVVGTGFKVQSRVRPDTDASEYPRIIDMDAEKYNTAMEKNFTLWARGADKRLILNFDYMLRNIEGSLLRDGAVLAVGRSSDRKGRLIPYCQDLYEIDRLQTPIGERSNPKIRHGIEYDEEGVPKTYYILKQHPGDSVKGRIGYDKDFEEVPAYFENGTKKVFHLFNSVRTEQSIGYTQFAAALKDYQDLDRYREAEIMAALEAACLTGFIKTLDPGLTQLGRSTGYGDAADGAGNERRVHEFSPGEWHYLNPGEDMEVFHPNRPNDIFGQFTEQLLSGPANALDMPIEMLTQNWKGMNYSNARTVLLQFYLSCFIRRKYLLDFYCIPVYEIVARQMIATGKVSAKGFATREADYLKHNWITPGWAWVDPVKEAQGKEIELENNMDTLGDIAASKGKDWEELLEQRAMELKKKMELEKLYGITFPVKTAKQPVTDTDTDKDDEADNASNKKSKVVKL